MVELDFLVRFWLVISIFFIVTVVCIFASFVGTIFVLSISGGRSFLILLLLSPQSFQGFPTSVPLPTYHLIDLESLFVPTAE